MAGAVATTNYPTDLDPQIFWNCDLAEYSQLLEKESQRVLQNQPYASVDFLTLASGSTEFASKQVRNDIELKSALGIWSAPQSSPRCQYVSIHAPSSRKKLRITKSMLQMLLSQYRTMPSILDYLSAFGKNSQDESFNFSSCRTEEFLVPSYSFQLCYNLRDVEPSPKQSNWPWSIRQTAVAHGFDLRTGDATWITIKGNEDMANRFRQITRTGAPLDPIALRSPTEAFKSSLTAHLVFCEWSRDNWSRYIGYLGSKLQSRTKHAVLATVNQLAHTAQDEEEPSPTDSSAIAPDAVKKSLTWAEKGRAVGRVLSARVRTFGLPHSKTAPLPSPDVNALATSSDKPDEFPEYKDFSYDDLRNIHFVEDKTNQCLLAVRSNTSILEELRHHYETLQASPEFTAEFGDACNAALSRFFKRISSVISDLKNQQSNLEMLLQTIKDRKALLFGLFDHRNMSTNMLLAKESRQSAHKMHELNIQMKDIATKTEAETVVMRIVTLATLFFLPGTFVATLLSTDIVKFQDNGVLMKKLSWPALGVYLGLTIPIMLITFLLAHRYMKKARRNTIGEHSPQDSSEKV